jgi:hypothetical protein
LRNFGLKVGMVGTVRFEARIQKLVDNLPDMAALVEPLLIVRRALRDQIVILHRRLLAIRPLNETLHHFPRRFSKRIIASARFSHSLDPSRTRAHQSVSVLLLTFKSGKAPTVLTHTAMLNRSVLCCPGSCCAVPVVAARNLLYCSQFDPDQSGLFRRANDELSAELA